MRCVKKAETGKLTFNCHLSGEDAYDNFKKIATQFYEDSTYKFCTLKLTKEPKSDDVEFTAEFWPYSIKG